MNLRITVLRERISKVTRVLTADYNLIVTQAGAQAFVDYDKITGKPKRVNIPFIPDNADDALIAAVEGFIDHEVGHVLFSDVEVLRESTADMKSQNGKLLASLTNMIEDVYVENQMRKRFAGCESNLKAMHNIFTSRIIDPYFREAITKPDASLRDAFDSLICCAIRSWGGQQHFKDYMSDKWIHLGSIRAIIERDVDIVKKMAAAKSSRDSIEIAKAILKAIQDNSSDEGDGEGESPTSGSGKKKSKPVASKKQDKPSEENENEGESEGEGEGDSEEENEEGSSKEGDKEKSKGKEKKEKKKKEREKSEGKEKKEKKGKKDKGDEGESEQEDEQPGDSGEQDKNEGEGEEKESSGQEGEDESAGDESEEGENKSGDESEDESSQPSDEGDDDSDQDESDDGSAGTGDESEGEDQVSGDDDSDASETGEDDASNMGDGDNDRKPNSEDEGNFESDPEMSSIIEEDRTLMDFDSSIMEIMAHDLNEAQKKSTYLPYTKDWDVIEEYKVPSKGKPRTDELSKVVDSMTTTMTKSLERAFVAMNKSNWWNGLKSGRMHDASLSRLVTNDPRIFRRKIESKTKDVAVSLVWDCSGSMNGQKMQTAGVAAWAMSEVLTRLKINHEIIGFTTGHPRNQRAEQLTKQMHDESAKRGGGYHGMMSEYSRFGPIYMPVFKRFGEGFGPEQRKRIAAAIDDQNMMGANVDGESIQYAAERLLKQKEPGKIMIVLSDGEPAGPGDGAEFRSHLRKTVKDLMKMGINIVGIGINTRSVSEFYPKHVYLNDVSDLPKTVVNQLRDAILVK